MTGEALPLVLLAEEVRAMISQTVHHRKGLFAWREQLRAIPWWGQCIALWLATLVVLTAVGLLSAGVAAAWGELGEGYQPWLGLSPASIPGIWVHWDSDYYIRLADQGYAAMPEACGFFPLYPALMAGLSRISGLGLAMAGMLISGISYLAAILCFYKLARLVQDDHAYAMRSVLHLVVFPSSFFFFAVYAESVYLFFAILSVYLVMRAHPSYVQAGLTLGLASLARPVGWLLDVVPVVEFIRRRRFNLSSLLSLAAGLAFSVLGIVLFVLYLNSVTGSFMAIPQAQSGWQRQWQFPWVTLWRGIYVAVTGQGAADKWFLRVINWSDLLFTGLALVLTALALWRSLRRKLGWGLSLYLACSIACLLSMQGLPAVPLWGMTRWVAALFPLYLILGNVSQSRVVRQSFMAISAAMELGFTAWWTSGRWVG